MCLHFVSIELIIDTFYRNLNIILIMADLIIDKEAFLRRITKLYLSWEVSIVVRTCSNVQMWGVGNYRKLPKSTEG